MKRFIISTMVFALGVVIGLIAEPIGSEINRQYLSPVMEQPAQQKDTPTAAVVRQV